MYFSFSTLVPISAELNVDCTSSDDECFTCALPLPNLFLEEEDHVLDACTHFSARTLNCCTRDGTPQAIFSPSHVGEHHDFTRANNTRMFHHRRIYQIINHAPQKTADERYMHHTSIISYTDFPTSTSLTMARPNHSTPRPIWGNPSSTQATSTRCTDHQSIASTTNLHHRLIRPKSQSQPNRKGPNSAQ